MKITYDNKLKLAGIGLVPWTRLGPDIWFDDYKITSLYDWDIALKDVPEVFALTTKDPSVKLPRLNTQAMLGNEQFKQILINDLAGYDFLTYKPVSLPTDLEQERARFLSTDTSLARKLENKAYFRNHFSPLGIPFPRFTIHEDVEVTVSEVFLEKILDGRSEVILQDSELSGGKGTHVVRDIPTLSRALESIKAIGGSGTVVVSEKIAEARERTVQCVVTRYGVFVGPLQKQIIAHPLLANLSVADGDKFCGAEISKVDECADAYPEIKKHALAIGEELRELGYKGIYGVDCLVDAAGEVFVLEVNPRITGVTPLVTMLYREGKDIPFYLLHILELLDADYEITDDSVSEDIAEGSLLMLHSPSQSRSVVTESPDSGVYNEALQYMQAGVRFDVMGGKQVLVQQYAPVDFEVRPGGRLISVFINDRVMDADDYLLPKAQKLVEGLLNMVKLEEL